VQRRIDVAATITPVTDRRIETRTRARYRVMHEAWRAAGGVRVYFFGLWTATTPVDRARRKCQTGD
jgi:hypothetical protein